MFHACGVAVMVQGWTTPTTRAPSFLRPLLSSSLSSLTALPATTASSTEPVPTYSNNNSISNNNNNNNNNNDDDENRDNNHDDDDDNHAVLLESFVEFLLQTQDNIIAQLEEYEAKFGGPSSSSSSNATFSRDAWGCFETNNNNNNNTTSSSSSTTATTTTLSGGLTRVLQGGTIIEKGACSLTVLRQGTLSAERAATICARQQDNAHILLVQAGDVYTAAALSMVLHSKSPHVPTFRSDVRVFSVTSSSSSSSAIHNKTRTWLGGGADLTPYYCYDADIALFHGLYRDLCAAHNNKDNKDDDETVLFSYPTMKKACDEYFYLPARAEHRGTGGIFFDDLPLTLRSLQFVQGVADTWMPSWLPIVEQRQHLPVTMQQRQWQLLRRGRYLEFNLLYDRGVKFGLAVANPRVEGVMVSAPPLIAWEYNHQVEVGSEEERLMKILKHPVEWVCDGERG